MSFTLAFDVYGTLIDTHGLLKELEIFIGDKAQDFSQTWRDKQLEYSFRRGLMNNYLPFTECTRSALDYACKYHHANLSEDQKSELMQMYAKLPAFPDTATCFKNLDSDVFDCFAFSNGMEAAVRGLIEQAGIQPYLKEVISVDDIKTFKPNPATYDYFMQRSEGELEKTWLISSNPFDVIGARTYGLQAAWVQRSESAIFDDWEVQPSLVVSNLNSLGEKITNFYQ